MTDHTESVSGDSVSGRAENTGDERVDAALDKLDTVASLPLAAQVTVFDDVHRLLQDALSDGAPGPGGPSGR